EVGLGVSVAPFAQVIEQHALSSRQVDQKSRINIWSRCGWQSLCVDMAKQGREHFPRSVEALCAVGSGDVAQVSDWMALGICSGRDAEPAVPRDDLRDNVPK